MSNFLAIATVTETLRNMVLTAVQSDIPSIPVNVDVTKNRPDEVDKVDKNPLVNIFLYQVMPNATLRNDDLPTRGPKGHVINRPCVALDLHYLLSFYGDEAQLEPQRLLGSTVRTLHAQPVLTRKRVQQALETAMGGDSNHYLNASNLPDAIELVRISPLSLSLEELAKLWSVFFQTRYALSVAYMASVVLIEEKEMPQAPLSVKEPRIHIAPFRRAVIETLRSKSGPDEPFRANQPILTGYFLVIEGRGLSGEETRVRIGGRELKPEKKDVTERRIILKIPQELRAGVHSVRVVHFRRMGGPEIERRREESNVMPFVLCPTIVSPPSAPNSTEVTVQVIPNLQKDQRVVLLLNERSTTNPAAYKFEEKVETDETGTMTFPISGVKAGEYWVRVQVDGAESVLEYDESSPDVGPTVEIL